jgi:hypothetical protein
MPSRTALAISALAVLALDAAPAGAEPRHDFCADLGDSFGFGVSAFSVAGDWLVAAHDTSGVGWRFVYIYVVPTDDPPVAVRDWIRSKVELAHGVGAIPVLTFYELLMTGQRAGFAGDEATIVRQTLESATAMRAYFDSFVAILEDVADLEPVLVHVEPDSWGFMIWAMGVEGNDDPTSVAVQVAGSGHPELGGFADDASGFGHALVALRDAHAPAVRLGWHASNFRAGTRPEVTAAFFSQMGDWDVLIGESPHLEADPLQWWLPWDEGAIAQNLEWFHVVTSSAGLPILLWQLPIGTTDFHLLGVDGTDRAMLERFAQAGVAGALFEHNASGGDPDTFRAYEQSDFATVPPPESGAGGTAADLRTRLAAYSAAPLAWPAGSLCASTDSDADGDIDADADADADADGGAGDGGADADGDGGDDGDGGGCGCRASGGGGSRWGAVVAALW